MSDSKVVSIFSKRKVEEENLEKQETSVDFEEVQKANAAKAERLAKERKQHNKRVKNEYRLMPKK